MHAGAHKTGTTAIQAVLSDHREELSECGLYYPDSKPFLGGSHQAHHELAHALSGVDSDAVAAALQFLEYIASEARADQTVLLSAEAFYRHLAGVDGWIHNNYWLLRRRYLRDVAKALAGFEVRVLLVLRRPDEFAESLYKEAITRDFYWGPFERFIDDWPMVFDYNGQVEAFRAAFGEVAVRSYHEGPVVETFFDAVGVAMPEGVGEVWKRRSPDTRLIVWMADSDPKDRKRQREFVLSSEAQELFDGTSRMSLWSSASQRNEFLAQFGGEFGTGFFPSPPPWIGELAALSETDRARIDRAYADWCGPPWERMPRRRRRLFIKIARKFWFSSPFRG
ncbi:MAG: hypothetical protein ACRDJS_09070 [Actinomycetota bacterium]